MDDCFSQAYLTEMSSKSDFWFNLSEIERQGLLVHFKDLLKWRLSEPFNLKGLQPFYIFNMSIVYSVNFKESINNYKNNIDLYIHNVFNILDSNREDILSMLAINILTTSNTLRQRQDNVVKIELTQGSAKLNNLMNLYNFINYKEAQKYLANDTDLLSLLKDTHSKIVEYFDSDKVSLSFIESIDISESFALEIIIKVAYDLDSATDRRYSFNNNYWFDLPFDLTKNIMMDFEFE